MTQIAQGAHVYLFPEPGQVYRVQADDVATVQVLYGAPSAVITLTAQSQTFGPYDSPAKLKVTANTAPAEYTLIRAHYAELTPEQIAGGAVGVLGSNNSGGVVEPDGDVPTLGGSVTLPAMQAALNAGSAAEKAAFQSSVSGDAMRLQVGAFGVGSAINGSLLTQITIVKPCRVNQITLNWTATGGGTYYEAAIYSADLQTVMCRSGVREHPQATGILRVALPETALAAGIYWVALASSGGTAAASMTSVSGEVVARTFALTLPLPSAVPPGSAYASYGLSFALEYAPLPAPTTAAVLTTGTVRVYGNNPANSQPWGWNTVSGKLCYSVNSGASWVDAMNYPPLTVGAPIDITVNNGKLYLFTTDCELWATSDLTASATWTNISVPIATGWRRSIAKGRPYGMIIWNDWLFVGEYTSGVDMNTDPNWSADQAGPRVFRYGPLSGSPTWVLSKSFNSARHVHSFFSPGASYMMVSLGDLGQWTNGQKTGTTGISADVGIHRITAITAGGPDTWLDWTGNNAPCTTHYPVDFLNVAGRSDAPDGMYGASDSVGIHLQYFRTSGTPGALNNSAQAFRKNADAGETVRSLAYDPTTGNLYYWTVETADPGIYVSPPPYTQTYRLFSVPMTAVQVRSIVSGGYLLQFDQRISLCKFPWQ